MALLTKKPNNKMPRKKSGKFGVVFDTKGNLWVQGAHMKRFQDWLRKGAAILEETEESSRKRKRSKK